MKRIATRLMLAVFAWVGLDSALDHRGLALAVVHRPSVRVFPLHHRYVLYAAWSALRERLPFAREEEHDEEGEVVMVVVEEEALIPEPTEADPEQVLRMFDAYSEHIERLSNSAPSDERSERFTAANREIVRTLGADLPSEAVWRGVLLATFAMSSAAQSMAAHGVGWPHPSALADTTAASLAMVRRSLALEADLPDLDFVLPDEDEGGSHHG